MSNFEKRLEDLKRDAAQNGTVDSNGVHARGGPMPENRASRNYYGLPLLKPPVWEWMIPVYFFVGGLAGMSGLMAVGGLIRNDPGFTRCAMWFAGVGAILSVILLVWDLGRPMRFIYMLRVFKYQSPMSVGSWILSAFGTCAVAGLIFTEWRWRLLERGTVPPWLDVLISALTLGSGLTGIFLATYTGALLGVTAVPAWFSHHVLLPFHFGMAALGSAAAALELAGYHNSALNLIGFFAASAQTVILARLELSKRGAIDRALHEGASGWTLRIAELLEGPLSLLLRAVGFYPLAAAAFLLGALLSRFGWMAAGTRSASDPESVFASQTD